MTRKKLLWGMWCGPAFAVLFGIGFALMLQFLPPPHAHDSAEEIVAMYREHPALFRAGTALMILGVIFIAPWGAAMASQTRRTERGFPILTAIQLICTGVVVFTIVLFTLIWAVASFRAGDIPAETTRTLNDLAFFLLLFDWSPFCLWCCRSQSRSSPTTTTRPCSRAGSPTSTCGSWSCRCPAA
jgi:hypothetical protein